MEDTRISDLAKAIMEATSVREVIDSNGGHVNVGTNRFYLQVNDDVSIIVKTGIDPNATRLETVPKDFIGDMDPGKIWGSNGQWVRII